MTHRAAAAHPTRTAPQPHLPRIAASRAMRSVADCAPSLVLVPLSPQNYSLKHSAEHKWFYYTRQKKEECLVFKVYDKKADGPRFVFHTAFDDPMTPADAPPRKSIEVRAIAFYDPPPLGIEDAEIKCQKSDEEEWRGR